MMCCSESVLKYAKKKKKGHLWKLAFVELTFVAFVPYTKPPKGTKDIGLRALLVCAVCVKVLN